ncbi:LPS export ABC transporter permease LptF [Sodalis endosymbiont of Henestaris halophilus]|uniref:LPS export ABC transporter permease LptF n=1 Tax=Sodalis endosymbiont of Henestaris halophilus TaxID=1929246 RepID=UPI000BBF3ED7|nr:LPS export ABC transporter permease LptF [Sodalis endosymbiont of Henestaris halophilus]SNC59077.1 Lipopolysaccharide export system permease protein LptF [Sodalis endosymbiont of Henestaris halophilus]
MIITKYLVRETFKSQLTIFFILLFIFSCQKLVRILETAINGYIPKNIVLPLLGLGIPEMAQLILPMCLFLALLMTLNRMYAENEITVMHSCGLGKNILIRAMLLLSLITAIFATVNVIWLSPWSSRYHDLIMLEAKVNMSMLAMLEGKFKPAKNSNAVLFIGNFKDTGFENLFLAQIKPKGNARPSVVIADRGHMIQRKDGSLLVILDKGARYEGTAMLRDFRITDFIRYQAIIDYKSVPAESTNAAKMTLCQLWHATEPEERAELHWRFTLVVSVLIMAMIVMPLSVVKPRYGLVLGMVPTMLLYLFFFLLQTSLRTNGAKGRIDPMLWMWLTNVAYLALALVLYLWDSIPARKMRSWLHTIGTV